MAFRGTVLQLVDAESELAFRVVAPDAELMLPHGTYAEQETLLTTSSQQKLVVVDAVSRKLLQVTRLATVVLQHQRERSVLWSVTASSLVVPESGTVGETPRKHATASRAAAVASPSRRDYQKDPLSEHVQRTTEDVASATRRCYCFHFRSDFEYQLFAHTLAACTRMQQYALLKRSVVMEMEIRHEHQKQKEKKEKKKEKQEKEEEKQAAEDVPQQAVVSRPSQQLEVLPTTKKDEQDKKKQQVAPSLTKATAKAQLVIATPPRKMLCALCRILRKPGAPEYPKHPFVLKDGKSEVVHICKVCLQRVLKQRVAMQASATKSSQDNICGLCARSMEKMSAKSIKACAHEVCPRVYCIPCIDKLIGKARAHIVWRTKDWLCPNCSTDDNIAPAGDRTDGAGSLSVEIVAAAPAPKQRKRKRCKEIERNSTAKEGRLLEAQIPASLASEMQLIDYAATYFKFLVKREKTGYCEESEDVCFCCKDGGDLIECDWKGMNGAFKRCPKVYHEDCLGYKVPARKTWFCPRHRCQDCGIIAQYSCRFCVTSYCNVCKLCPAHLPKDVKRLGHATKDIPTSTYVMCPRCTQQVQDAFKQKKVGSDLHSKLFRGRAGKR